MKAKKSLGQYFLTSRGALLTILRAADIASGDTVLEIGPGKGVLTEVLLKSARKVVAVEKDKELLPFLNENFKKEIISGKLELQNSDILFFDPETLRRPGGSYLVVANIPYYITGAILEKFLETTYQPSRMVILVQKEVAERIARGKKGSILSMSVRAYGTPRYVATVKRGSFSPAPAVDSAILSIENISKNNFKNKEEEEKFFKVLKAGFAHKRKFLSANLQKISSKENINRAFTACGIETKARAEEITADTWKCLARELLAHKTAT